MLTAIWMAKTILRESQMKMEKISLENAEKAIVINKLIFWGFSCNYLH
jgi:hypothetical protein